MNTHQKIKEVSKWLSENTKSFETPKKITLFNFEINRTGYSGRFSVMLDDITIKSKFSFGLGGNGKPEIYFPMFYSPLGAPASYASVSLTDETEQAIKDLLASILPTMKALGLEKETGEWITAHSVERRIVDRAEFDQKMTTVSEVGFKAIKRCSLGEVEVSGNQKE